ncbi:MAG: YeeE/YedE thiosulfate transporter family protein [Lentisphaeria bacterium]
MTKKTNNRNKHEKPYMNPYLAGILLGFTLLASYLILGAGLGASAGIARVGAYCELLFNPARTLASKYFGNWGGQPLNYYLVFMLAGVFFGGLISALLSRRNKITVECGTKCRPKKRLIYALAGGIIVGFASRLANGCTSGQALSGSTLLLTGSLLFLICVFIGGYATAYFVRGQWHD